MREYRLVCLSLILILLLLLAALVLRQVAPALPALHPTDPLTTPLLSLRLVEQVSSAAALLVCCSAPTIGPHLLTAFSPAPLHCRALLTHQNRKAAGCRIGRGQQQRSNWLAAAWHASPTAACQRRG